MKLVQVSPQTSQCISPCLSQLQATISKHILERSQDNALPTYWKHYILQAIMNVAPAQEINPSERLSRAGD